MNVNDAFAPGGQVEILTGTGTSASATSAAVEQAFRMAGFCGVTGQACGYAGLIRIVGVM